MTIYAAPAYTPCTCDAWRFPHRPGSGECHGHDLADCPDQIVVVDPYGTGDRWHRWIDHGCKTMKKLRIV